MYEERLPPKRSAITVRSAARTSRLVTRPPDESARRARSALCATSRSCTSRLSFAIAAMPIVLEPTLHIAPLGSRSCPSPRSALNFGPIRCGALQSWALRAQRYAHAASTLSGSRPASLYVPQPHDQTVATSISAAISRAASACHLTTRNHSSRGRRPSRPPVPGALWNPSISPIRVTGIPISTRLATARRNATRMRRFASSGPWTASERP
jgi:hypothetical protein